MCASLRYLRFVYATRHIYRVQVAISGYSAIKVYELPLQTTPAISNRYHLLALVNLFLMKYQMSHTPVKYLLIILSFGINIIDTLLLLHPRNNLSNIHVHYYHLDFAMYVSIKSTTPILSFDKRPFNGIVYLQKNCIGNFALTIFGRSGHRDT